MLFPSHLCPLSPYCHLRMSELNRSRVHESFGRYFSNNMKWNNHVEYIIKKACKRIVIIRNLRRANCPTGLMIRCYIAFIRSLLTFVSHVVVTYRIIYLKRCYVSKVAHSKSLECHPIYLSPFLPLVFTFV